MNHIRYMSRALELAEWGRGYVSPNPLVGCVIVYEDTILGEGWHREYGGPHAEVHAVQSIKDRGLLPESTVYVSLEPCAHWGKTPPCANFLVDNRVKRVVIAATDPNPLVGGKGIEILKNAGIEVVTGIMEKEARWQNRRFFTQIEKQRPYVILKWAETKDGFLARENFDSKWISNTQSRQLVHKWRAEEDAVLIGKNTAAYDNPRLDVRDWVGKNPVRIVLDSRLDLPGGLKIFDGKIPTLVFNTLQSASKENVAWIKLEEIHPLPILEQLYSRKIQSLIVEGGSQVLQEFIQAGLWDEARVFTSPTHFERGIPAPALNQNPSETLSIGTDRLDIYYYHG
jgi:diaminohydroxyphosphoribosylaminopyrimidine deaminase/5-amino-6-(5-phosphoribosylamino)uracil reductase